MRNIRGNNILVTLIKVQRIICTGEHELCDDSTNQTTKWEKGNLITKPTTIITTYQIYASL